MTPVEINAAAAALKTARVEQRRIDTVPESCRPSTLEAAYQIQDKLIELLAEPIYGWKIGATSQKARDAVGISTGAICARMLARATVIASLPISRITSFSCAPWNQSSPLP